MPLQFSLTVVCCAMALTAFSPINATHHSTFMFPLKQHHQNLRIHRLRCSGTNPNEESQQPQNNAFLKLAWYSSELLGIAASVFRSPITEEPPPQRLLQTIHRAAIVDTIKEDFQRSYFVTGFPSPTCLISLGYFQFLSFRSLEMNLIHERCMISSLTTLHYS